MFIVHTEMGQIVTLFN